MEQNQPKVSEIPGLEETENMNSCSCEKKQCMLGIASIAIGVGGFVLASLL